MRVCFKKCRHGGPTTSAGLESTLRNKAARFFFFCFVLFFSDPADPAGSVGSVGSAGHPSGTFRNLPDLPEVVPELFKLFKGTNKTNETSEATSRTRAPSGALVENWTGHGQKAAALWPNTTYTKFGHIPSKKGTWICPNTCTHACNVHVVPIIVLKIFSYPKFCCLIFFYDKN